MKKNHSVFGFVAILFFIHPLAFSQYIYPVDFHEQDIYYRTITVIPDDPSLVETAIPVSFWTQSKNYFFFESYKTRAMEQANKLLANNNNSNIHLYYYESNLGVRPHCDDKYGPRHFSKFLSDTTIDREGRGIQNSNLPLSDFFIRASEYQIKCIKTDKGFLGVNGGFALLRWFDSSIGEIRESVFRSYSNKGTFLISDLFTQEDFDSIYQVSKHNFVDQFGVPIPIYEDLAVAVIDGPSIGGGTNFAKKGVQLVVRAGGGRGSIRPLVNGLEALDIVVKKLDNFVYLANKFRFPPHAIEWVTGFKLPINFKKHVGSFKVFWHEGGFTINGAHTEEAFFQGINALRKEAQIAQVVVSEKTPLKGFIFEGKLFAYRQEYVVKDIYGNSIKRVKTYFDTNVMPISDIHDLLSIAANSVYKRAIEISAKVDDVINIRIGELKFRGVIGKSEGTTGPILSTIFPVE
ncbi:MAG: hypothetical protein QE271_11165 [Bacteriovoracaceae bacterium]|nr:hypothetical protein [Bacteriovoracaceae bacterium]